MKDLLKCCNNCGNNCENKGENGLFCFNWRPKCDKNNCTHYQNKMCQGAEYSCDIFSDKNK